MNKLSIKKIDHLVITVNDIKKTIYFYSVIMGMQEEYFIDDNGFRRLSINFGTYKINIHEKGNEFEPKAQNVKTGSLDICFLSEELIEKWIFFLNLNNIKIIEGPVERIGATGKMTSIYIRDPDNNLIEISKKL
tara:strand:- start:106 stop:507 length:402 start_codon:yes stop_codon:yes gene_type:complete